MRNLAIRLVLWLCARFDINPLDEARRFASPDAIVRGQRWEAFYHEEGGLADMIAAIRKEAFEAAAELDPSDTDKIYYWATADRNLRKLDQRVRGIVANGKIAAKQADYTGAAVGMPRKSV
jgi:hypothetical protein